MGKRGTKPKMHAPAHPREDDVPRHEQVQAEIRRFLQAVDSYPAQAAKKPNLSFRQHLSSFFSSDAPRLNRYRHHRS